MRARFAVLLVMLVGVGLTVSACGGLVDPSKNQLETVTGTITGGHVSDTTGSLAFSTQGPYNVSKSGEYVVTFTNLTPPLALNFPITIAFGLYSSGSCQAISNAINQSSTVGHQVLGTTITPGSYCIIVADQGYMSANVVYTFTLSFSHP